VDYQELSSTKVLPRLARIGAPFFLYYHNYSDAQADALCSLADCAVGCGLWTPTVTELSDYYQERERAEIDVRSDEGAMLLTIRHAPEGAWMTVRLPDGRVATEVVSDRRPLAARGVRRQGISYVRVPVVDGVVTVRHAPDP
jgi:hypothetical protein